MIVASITPHTMITVNGACASRRTFNRCLIVFTISGNSVWIGHAANVNDVTDNGKLFTYQNALPSSFVMAWDIPLFCPLQDCLRPLWFVPLPIDPVIYGGTADICKCIRVLSPHHTHDVRCPHLWSNFFGSEQDLGPAEWCKPIVILRWPRLICPFTTLRFSVLVFDLGCYSTSWQGPQLIG